MTSFGSDLILARMQSLHPKCIDLSLDRLWRLLDRLGNPQQHLPPVVHIAGTNGKGSTLAMLDAMLAAAGYRVDRYVSPHLIRFNERILQSGSPIAEAALVEALERCEHANAGEAITFFEITTAAALVVFSERPADILLLETGLGGRLDATNVIERPLATMISTIGMDHQGFLGDTIELIAAEKAGIIKRGVPVFVGDQDVRAAAVLAAKASSLRAPFQRAGTDWHVTPGQDGFTLQRAGAPPRRLPRPTLAGVHQLDNAALATVTALSLPDFHVDAEAISRGLRDTRWPARLQRLYAGPLVDLLPRGHELWLDGGHNPSAGRALAASLPALADGKPVHLVLGMLTNKDARGFLEPLLPHLTSVATVPIKGEENGRHPEDLAAEIAGMGGRAQAHSSTPEAVAAIAKAGEATALTLLCGSLYLAGNILREHG